MTNIFLTPKQAAQILNVSLSTLKKFIYSGQIKTLKTPGGHHRIRKRDLFQMVGSRERPRHSKTKQTLITTALVISIISLGCPSQTVYPFAYKGLDLNVGARIAQIYDNNITSRNEGEIDDFISDLSFGLGLKYEGKTQNFDLMANINQQFFADNDNFNNTSEDLTMNFQKEFSKFERISLQDVFTHTYEPRSFEEAFGRTTGRYSYYRNRFNFTYEKDFTKQFSARIRYANEMDEISREELSDSWLNRAGLEAAYFLSSASILLFSYDFSKRDFDPGNSASMQTILSGIRHYFTKQLYFDGQAGIDLIDSYNKADYSKPLIQVSLTNDIDEDSRASISFAKRYYTNAYSEDLFDYWRVSANFIKQLLKRLKLSLSAFYGEGEYIAASVSDKLKGASIGLTYDLSKKTKLNLNYTYSNVDSTLDTREYSKNRVTLAFVMEF